jgi:serine/threonine-protein kinase
VFHSDFFRATPFFTMEYLECGCLARQLDGGPLPPGDAVRIVRAIAGALSAAHAQEVPVIHRDVKPSNILLTADGMPKVADFGLVKLLGEVDPITVQSGGLGTPSYMPPEQISKEYGEIGVWSDVYGLGATLYHLLTGRAPFTGSTPLAIVRQVPTDPPPEPRTLRPEIPIGLEAIVLKCLEKNPKCRYQSMAELVRSLDRYEAGEPDPDTPIRTRWRRFKLWVGRHRVRIAASAAAVVLALGLVAAGRALAPVPPVRVPEDPARPDPGERIRTELRARRPVVLVGDGGEPRFNWRVGSGTFGKADPGDGLLFETIDTGLLELLDDPGIDSYTIRAQIRQTRSLAAADLPNRRRDEDSVGVYFGHADLSSANPPTHAFFAVRFADYDPVTILGNPVKDQPAALVRALRTFDAEGKLRHPATVFAQCLFKPVEMRPGLWRTIEIDVTPTELRARWQDAQGKMKPLIGKQPIEPGRHFAALQEALNEIRPNSGIVLPVWSPRMPLGIYARASALNVRNVTITPNPVP